MEPLSREGGFVLLAHKMLHAHVLELATRLLCGLSHACEQLLKACRCEWDVLKEAAEQAEQCITEARTHLPCSSVGCSPRLASLSALILVPPIPLTSPFLPAFGVGVAAEGIFFLLLRPRLAWGCKCHVNSGDEGQHDVCVRV